MNEHGRRRRVLRKVVRRGATVALAGLVAAALAGPGVLGQASASRTMRVTLDVKPDLSTFDATRVPEGADPYPTGPFYVEGKIYPSGTLSEDGSVPVGAEPIGTFRCWGWGFDGATGAAVIQQAFEVEGRGEVQVQGVEDGLIPVTGGSGIFKNAFGNAKYGSIVFDPAAGNIAFRLTVRVRS